MAKLFPVDTPRLLHLTIIGLLLFSVVQVMWWFYDQRSYAQLNERQVRTLYDQDVLAAQRLAQLGVPPDQIRAIFSHIRLENGQALLAPSALTALGTAKHTHVTQYAWESGFFLLVQAFAIIVLLRGLSGEAEIRRRQDSFLAMVSHQFKTPLASLQLSLETMVMRELSPERFQQLTRRMRDDLRRMENMVAKILDSARLDRGRVTLNRERLFLAEAVRHVVGAVEEAARRDNISFELKVPPDLDLYADPMAVDGVLRNLVENAVAAMGPTKGGVLSIAAHRFEGGVELTVRDTGVGFEPAQAEKLFERFFRLDTMGGRDAAGTGLGLFIVQRFMHFEHGQVRAASDGPGRGATFTVTWPVVQDVAA